MNTHSFKTQLPKLGHAPLIYAHRGAMAYCPQNTLPAFALAWAMGVDGIELDVQCSKDGVPLVFHDDTLEALTDGAGRTRDHDWAYLAQLDAGSHFSAEFKDCRIPTLEAVLRARPFGTFVNIELKTELPFDNEPNASTRDNRPVLMPEPLSATEIEARRIAQRTADCVQAVAQDVPDLLEHLIITSFHPAAIEAFHVLMPSVAIGHLFSRSTQFSTSPMMSKTPNLTLHLDVNDVSQADIEQAHAEGKHVNCWTVNEIEDAQRLIDWHVDGILTNYPDIMMALLKER
ncbi:glycerophosphodiester phosphodiesterase [Hydromonas duriensis]|uniref:Glycerophosphoryl diester phosphodiesterase n=1 Tax=Hydromonas duriensis TaxID=1527608 RepID=A0A4R6YA52_9BURK|nr:glycerophosphodiester phosphodiesterase family protein [Hydromonas duriensis]TDR32413.1 glycerophosphoryl diester phosphodiesterase [Hydromonas duriensis]